MVFEWYAVRTKSRHEKKVDERLKEKLFTVFWPKIEVWSRRKDRKKKILASLFPGYLFVKCDLTSEIWLDIIKTHGVAGMVSLVNEPTPIPESQIESVKKILDSKVAVKLHPFINVGDRVIVVEGPLEGAVGFYIQPNYDKGKLVVSLELLNRSIEVEVEGSAVEHH